MLHWRGCLGLGLLLKKWLGWRMCDSLTHVYKEDPSGRAGLVIAGSVWIVAQGGNWEPGDVKGKLMR